MPDEKMLARKLTSYSDVRSNLFSEKQQWLDDFVSLSIESLGALVASTLVDDMPVDQESGILSVTLTVRVGKVIQIDDAVLADSKSIMQRGFN